MKGWCQEVQARRSREGRGATEVDRHKESRWYTILHWTVRYLQRPYSPAQNKGVERYHRLDNELSDSSKKCQIKFLSSQHRYRYHSLGSSDLPMILPLIDFVLATSILATFVILLTPRHLRQNSMKPAFPEKDTTPKPLRKNHVEDG